MKSIVCCILASSACVALGSDLPEDSSQFRGFGGTGVVPSALPTEWDTQQNIVWSTDVGGSGWSSPVVVKDRVFLTTAVSTEFERPKGWGEGVSSMRSFYQSKPPQKPMSFEVHCLNLADGELLWKKQVALVKPQFKIHPSNSYATESPTTDGKHIYAYFAAVGAVACLDFDGNVIWKREVGAYPTSNDFGTGSSLALEGDTVFLQCDNDQSSFLVALDTKTGEDRWRVERSDRTSWSSPIVWKNLRRSELIVCGSEGVVSYDPSTGSQNWMLTGLGGSFSSTPASDEERIYLGQSGRNSRGPLIAINNRAQGNLTLKSTPEDGLAWTQNSAAPGMCSPVAVSGQVYVLSRGILSSHKGDSGELLFRSRLKDASSVTASLWAGGDKVYALNEAGQTAVVEVGSELKLAGSNTIPGLYWSTPAITSNSILMRSADKLYCIRN